MGDVYFYEKPFSNKGTALSYHRAMLISKEDIRQCMELLRVGEFVCASLN
jgi:hypothetical protein